MADEDNSDDDLYGTEETPEQKKNLKTEDGASSGDEPMDEAESGDEEDEDSESDLEIIIDKPPTAQKASAQQPPQESKAIKIEAPPASTATPSQPPRPSSTAPQQQSQHPAGSIVPQLALTPGTSYPAIRTSALDINANPTHPLTGKPLLSLDIDADLAESQKIWRIPGADQSDFFNYGFDEFTWELYRQRQINMTNALQLEKTQLQAMQNNMQMMGAPGPGGGNGGPGPAMPGMPPGMGMGGGGPMGPGGVGGMPNMSPEDMVIMMQAQGYDPARMNMDEFAQAMMNSGYGGGQQQQQQHHGGGGFQQQQQQQQGNHGGGGGGRGRGRGRGGW